MKSHTPGPWMVNDKAVGGIDIEDFNRAFVVCRTSSEDYPNADEELRHARLIAAAPELLAVVKEVINDMGAEDAPWYDAAIAAIAKAENGG